MSRFTVGCFDERTPIFEQVAAWEWLAVQRHPTKEQEHALSLPSDGGFVLNSYVHQMGSQIALGGQGKRAAEMVERVCDYRLAYLWNKNKKCFPAVFEQFFSTHDGPGWYSLTSDRSAIHARNDPQSGFFIEQHGISSVQEIANELLGHVAAFSLNGLWFCEPPDVAPGDSRLVMMTATREMRSLRFPTLNTLYLERWICKARRGVDDDHLRGGRIPAMLSDYEDCSGRPRVVRNTRMLTLMRVSPDRRCETGVIELHPVDGSVVSVRMIETMPLGSAILTYSPIELQSVSRTLSGKFS